MAAEQSQAFLDGLRERRYYDTAIDFLELARNSALADKDFRETIDCQLGIILVDRAWAIPPKDREAQLAEAGKLFRKFLAEHPQHALAEIANLRLAELLVKLGDMRKEQSGQADKTAEQRQQLLEATRNLFQESKELFAAAHTCLIEKYRAFGPVEKNDEERIAELGQIETDIVYAKLRMSLLTYEVAMTYDPGTNERKNGLSTAVDELIAIDDKYSPRLGAYYARISAARCYKELGNFDRALELLDNLVDMGSEPAPLSRMRSEATTLAIQIALMPESKKYKEAMSIFDRWEKGNTARSGASSEAMPVKCLAGEAILQRARELSADSPSEAAARKDLLQRAADLLTAAARVRGAYQHRAAVALADPLLAGSRVYEGEPRSFEEACERGRRAWDQIQVPGLKAEEQAKLREEGIECFRYALSHRPISFAPEDLNFLRYNMAQLCLAGDDAYDAAVLGEFLALRYSDWPKAQSAAKIALSAYAKMYVAPSDGDRQVEDDCMTRMANLIASRWPNTTAADDAWVTIARAAASIRQLPKAKEYLGRVPLASSRRGDAETLVGRALWKAYQDAAKLPKKKRLSKSEMANLLAQSQEWIEAGAGRMLDAGAEVNENLAAASCAMAQICLEKEMPAKAVEWLDHPKIGAHTLLSHPVTDQAGFRIDTLKLTLRAYIAAQRWNDFGPTLAALEEMGKGIALVPVYMSLGRQLEESLKQYEELHDTTQADQAAAILDSVLTRIFNRADAEVDFDCLNWTAEAFYHLGSRLDRGVKPGAEAVALYKKAGNVYGRILTMAAADPKFAPNPSAITDIEIARARCHRRLGEFNAAIAILVKILRSQNFLIAAQREAAYVYQGWGEERANNFLSAIRGANQIELNNKSTFTIVWGWGMISKRAMAGKGNEALYFEARYNMAFCRFRYAQTKANPERTALLRKAEQDILVVLRPYPEMGGKAWYDQFDQLLKRIQNALGDKEDGLKGANERILKELEKAAEPPADQSDQNQ